MKASRWLALTASAVVMSLGLTVAAPPGTAQAYTTLQACLENPAMLAICREAMTVALPPAGVAGVVSGQTVATGATAAVATSASAPSWATGFSAIVSAAGAALATIGGFLFHNGIAESRIDTDAEYVPVESGFADRVTVCSALGSCAVLKFSGHSTFGNPILCNVAKTPTGTPLDLGYSLDGGSSWTGLVLGNTGVVVDACAPIIAAEGANPGLAGTTVAAAVLTAVQNETVTLWRARDGYPNAWTAGVEWGMTSTPTGSIVGVTRVTLQCTDGTTTTPVVQMYPYDVQPGSPISFPETRCAPGWVLESMTVETQKAGQATWTEIATGQNPAEVVAVPTNYPACVSDVGAETCYLRLYDGGEWCGPGGVACPFWVEQETAAPGRFTCRYGPYSVDLQDCSAYRKPSAGVLPNRTTEGDPVPITAPAPSPAEIQPVKDPVTGTTFPDWLAVTNPTGTPSAQPRTAECFPSGWGILNPVEWVLKPVQCALEWAFIPRDTFVQSQTAAVNLAVSGSVIGVISAIPPAFSAAFLVGTELCSGPPMHLAFDLGQGEGMDETFYPLSACDAPMSGYAVLFRGLSSAAVGLVALFAVWRMVAGMVGFVAPYAGRAERSSGGPEFS